MDIAGSFVVAVVIAAAVFVYASWLHHQRALRARELAHEERMAAITHGLELPPHDALDDPGGGPAAPLTASGAGLVLVLGGVGMSVAFRFVPSVDGAGGLHTLASLGIIPIFIGVGLLLFAWATRNAARP
jgi:hypothetical protein